MQTLPFTMPTFNRLAWTSKSASDSWQERLKVAAHVYQQLELLSVAHNLRACTTLHVDPNDMLRVSQQLAEQGLMMLPIKQIGVQQGNLPYHPPVEQGKPWRYYCVVAKRVEDAVVFKKATLAHDDAVLGELLGYPSCCVAAFNERVTLNNFDPMWDTGMATPNPTLRGDKHVLRVSPLTPYNNVLLRYIGLRLMPHLPCSFSCEASAAQGALWLKLAQESGLTGSDDLIEVLSWPVAWDSLKGIAYVTTPLFKIITNSNTSVERWVVELTGMTYPEGAPSGLRFPWARLPSQRAKFIHTGAL